MRAKRTLASGVAGLAGLATLAALTYGAPASPSAAPGSAVVVAMTVSGPGTMGLPNAVVGDRTSGSLTVTNTGNTAADFTLSGSMAASGSNLTTLAQHLAVDVYRDRDNSGDPLWSGALAQLNTGSISLGPLYPAPRSPASAVLYVHVTLTGMGAGQDNNVLQRSGPALEAFIFKATQHTGR